MIIAWDFIKKKDNVMGGLYKIFIKLIFSNPK